MTTETVQKTQRELPKGWRQVRLGEVCHVVGGSTPSSDIKEFWDGHIIWITPTDLGQLSTTDISSSQRRITQAGYDNSGTEIVPPGAVVMSSRAPIGHLGIARVPICTNQGCKSFIPKPDVDSLFLYFALKRAVPELKILGSGSTFTEVSKTQLEQFEILLPTFSEQRRIASVLTTQMTAIKQARIAAETRLEATRALPKALLRQLFESEEIQRWNRSRLGELLRLRKDVIYPRDDPKGLATFVGLEHIETLTGNRIGAITLEMSNLTGRKPRFYKNDIVYGYLRPYLNKVWIAEFDGLCSVDQYVYTVDTKVADIDYIAWFMRSPIYLNRAPIDTTPGQLPRIRTEEVASVEIELPPLYIQQEISATLKHQLEASKAAHTGIQSQVNAIDILPTALLRRAFNGEL